MFTEKEFEKAMWLIRTLRHFITSNLLSNTAEQNALFNAFKNEGFKMDANNKEEDVGRNISVHTRCWNIQKNIMSLTLVFTTWHRTLQILHYPILSFIPTM